MTSTTEATPKAGAAALPTPGEYLAELARTAQIVLLGDLPGIRAHVDFVCSLVPTLAAAGVQNLAWDYTNTRCQAELDELTTAQEWDERCCADLFADLLGIGFAYQQYADVLRAVWAHNRSVSDGTASDGTAPAQPASQADPSGPASQPIRMIALGLPTYVEDPDLLDGRSAAELELRNWWMGGHYRDVSAFHAVNVLAEQVLRKGERAVVYADVKRTTTRQVQWTGGLATTSMGNLLHHWMGDGVRRVLLHGSIADPAATKRVEELVAASPESGKQGSQVAFGLDLAASTLGNIGITKVTGSVDGKSVQLRLRDVADGYLYLTARADWTPVALLDNLISDSNFAAIEERYRALVPRTQPYSLAELEQVRSEGIEQLQNDWPPEPDAAEEPSKRRFRFSPKGKSPA